MEIGSALRELKGAVDRYTDVMRIRAEADLMRAQAYQEEVKLKIHHCKVQELRYEKNGR